MVLVCKLLILGCIAQLRWL